MKERASPIAFITLAVTLFACGTSVTQASDVDMSAREARDRAEIQGLMWRYVRALDSFDADGYAATYTPMASSARASGRRRAAMPCARWSRT